MATGPNKLVSQERVRHRVQPRGEGFDVMLGSDVSVCAVLAEIEEGWWEPQRPSNVQR